MPSFLDEETTNPIYADNRNFYKVELWTKNDQHVERMLYAGNDIDKARQVFDDYARKRPRARLMIRQRARVLVKWPAD